MKAKPKARRVGQRVWQTKAYTLISNRGGPVWVWMPPEHSIFLGGSDEADIRFKVVHGLNVQPRNRP